MSLSLRTPARSLAVSAAAATLLLGPAMVPAHAATIQDIKTVTIVNQNSKKCLEVADWSQAAGAQVRQWDCTGGDNQKWVQVYNSDDSNDFFYRNVNSGMCLEIPGFNSSNGTGADQWPCNYGGNQAWWNADRPVLMTDGQAWNGVYNKCLEIGGWSMDNGAPADLWDCLGTPPNANQAWSINLAN